MLPRSNPSFLLLGILASVFLASCATQNTVSRGGFSILKVNRTLLDRDGYETDVVGDLKGEASYQYSLRHEPHRQTGARFHINLKAPRGASRVRLVLDVRGLTAANETARDTLSQSYSDIDGAEWTTIDITGSQFKRLGSIMAWRVMIYAGDRVMAELPSANWYSDIRPEPQAK